ncbi:MAG TPA: polysaccharide deacetylase family protein [Chryseosolibacter sp.]
MIPHRTPFFLPLFYPTLTWRKDSARKSLYLTFDDGPVSGPTEFVLDTLSRASASGSFFCLGDNIRKYPAIFRRILEEGHTVGNHTFSHLNGWRTPLGKYVSDVQAFEVVARESGLEKKTALFRPPYGRITGRQIRGLTDYDIIMWDVLSQDYNPRLLPEQCLRRTIKACRPGSIVVFHDSYKSEKNMEYTLPRVLDHFGGLGYSFEGLGRGKV